jgi:hypothetical protein
MADPAFLLDFQPGVQRDGTKFDATRYLLGTWCRWRLGRPRKMGGYRLITGLLNGLPRKIHGFYQGSQIFWHIGTAGGIQQVVTDTSGNFVSMADRTPSNFTGGTDVGWTLDALFDTTSKVVQLVAHFSPDQSYLATDFDTVPVLGDITSVSPLIEFSNPGPLTGGAVWTQPSVAGGVVCVQPFVFAFDSAGLVEWSAPNLALYLGVVGGSTGAGQARVSAQKIVAGMALRGGGIQQPAAIFWSLSEVIVASYVGTPAWFAFSTVSLSSSILSGDCVIEYDGLYFWVGVDRFLVFNGTVSEVPNPQNQDFFFDNLTAGYESQTFAFKVPRYGEIWWCAAMFGSTVPNWAVIFNVRENCWYDTPLPDGGRSAAYFAQGFRLPVMADVVNASGSGYGFWVHETGTDKVVAGQPPAAVLSNYETAWFGGPKNAQPDDRGLTFAQLEPDFIQSGDLSAWLIGAANARAPEKTGPAVPVLQNPTVPQEEFASFTPTMPTRLLRLHVESNQPGGSFISGRNMGHGQPAERRLVS